MRRGQAEGFAIVALSALLLLFVAVLLRGLSLHQALISGALERLRYEVERAEEVLYFTVNSSGVYALGPMDTKVYAVFVFKEKGLVEERSFTENPITISALTWTLIYDGEYLDDVAKCKAFLVVLTARGRVFSLCPQVYFTVNTTRAIAVFLKGGYYYAIPRLGGSNYSVAYVYRGGQWVKEPLQVYLWDANATYNIFYAPHDGYALVEPSAAALPTLATAPWFSTPSPSPQPYAVPSWDSSRRLALVRVVELSRAATFDGSALRVVSQWSLEPAAATVARSHPSASGGATYSVYFTLYDLPPEWAVSAVSARASSICTRVRTVGNDYCVWRDYAVASWSCLDSGCTRIRATLYQASPLSCGTSSRPCWSGSRVYAYWGTGSSATTATHDAWLSTVTDVYTEVRYTVDPAQNPAYQRTTSQSYQAQAADIGVGAPVKLITASNGNRIAVADFIAQLLVP